jgi:hypothetical protein
VQYRLFDRADALCGSCVLTCQGRRGRTEGFGRKKEFRVAVGRVNLLEGEWDPLSKERERLPVEVSGRLIAVFEIMSVYASLFQSEEMKSGAPAVTSVRFVGRCYIVIVMSHSFLPAGTCRLDRRKTTDR